MADQKTDEVATRVTDPNQSLAKILSDAMPELRKVAPKYVNLQRMASLAIEAKMRNPLLEKCSPVSVLNFCKRCAEAGTDRIGSGGMWAVPFWNKKNGTYDMTPMPDWRLIVEKAKKAKAITHATSEAVYENDEFDYERGLNPSLVHKPAISNRGKLKAVYCVYSMPDGTKDFVVMDIAEDIEPIHKRSKAAGAGPWVTDYAEMAKKTVVKRAMKIFEGASIELTALIATDNVASGYIDAEAIAPRTPIEMPKELPEPATSTAAATKQPQADEPSQLDTKTTKTVTGMVDVASVKNSPANAPKPWKKYGVKIGETWYSTFDEETGSVAAKGRTVTIVYKTNEKGYHDIVSMQLADQPADAPSADAPELSSTDKLVASFVEDFGGTEVKLLNVLRADGILTKFDTLDKLTNAKATALLNNVKGLYDRSVEIQK